MINFFFSKKCKRCWNLVSSLLNNENFLDSFIVKYMPLLLYYSPFLNYKHSNFNDTINSYIRVLVVSNYNWNNLSPTKVNI